MGLIGGHDLSGIAVTQSTPLPLSPVPDFLIFRAIRKLDRAVQVRLVTTKPQDFLSREFIQRP